MDVSSVALVVFDGYRGRDGGCPREAAFEQAVNSTVGIYRNHWNGHGDSLSDRLGRAIDWLDAHGGDLERVHIMGYSMGCHLAVRLARHVIDSYPSVDVGLMLLAAPDPKYRPVTRDLEERAAGITSAHDEAAMLWGVQGSPGRRFVSELNAVIPLSAMPAIVYCRADEVARWASNVELMIAELTEGRFAELVEAQDGAVVAGQIVSVDLSSRSQPAEAIHDRLWLGIQLMGSCDLAGP